MIVSRQKSVFLKVIASYVGLIMLVLIFVLPASHKWSIVVHW